MIRLAIRSAESGGFRPTDHAKKPPRLTGHRPVPDTSCVLRRLLFAAIAITTLAAVVGFTAEPRPLLPGDRVGTMLFVRGTVATADLKLFDICDPIHRIGLDPYRADRYRRFVRSCAPVPQVKRLFVGHGVFAAPRAINRVWHPAAYTAWFDRRRIRLRAFGTSDRPLYFFAPAGGKTVTLREWRVMVVNATPGAHTLRYRTTDASGPTDATWNFAVRRS